MSPAKITPGQTHALFDISIHHQLYSEIEAFKFPNAIDQYGFPFRKADGVQTTSPLLQNMLNKFALRLPGLKSVGLNFWQDKVSVLVKKMGEAELSESYDKGTIGARRALATAISSLLEYVARGMLGGYPIAGKLEETGKLYDVSKAEDILQAWNDGIRQMIYGDLLDELFEKVAASDKLEEHTSLVQAAHEFILLNLASFLHHIFVVSPDGQYLLRLLENIHRLIPYTLIRQTLRVGNAATMINGMVRLVLAKISVAGVTNWLGLTNNPNDGMNLMQQIISTVMAWDTSEFQKQANKLETCRNAPKKEIFKAIKTHVYASRDKHDAVRNISLGESRSVIAVILQTAEPPIPTDLLSDHHHEVATEYYSTYLSIRDREQLTKILCKLQPDLLTSAIRDAVSAFDPVIRAVHKAVDLSATLTDAESFLNDLVKVSKPAKPPRSGSSSRSKPSSRENSRSSSPALGGNPTSSNGQSVQLPTVEDYVHLLRTHLPSAHRFLHQICKNAPDLAASYRTYARAVLAEFRTDATATATTAEEVRSAGGAGNMTAPLQSLFAALPADKQADLLPILDAHEEHLARLKATSRARLAAILVSARPTSDSDPFVPSPQLQAQSQPGTAHGPGMYLARWHSLLDSAYITPASLSGPVRRGWEVKGELDGKRPESKDGKREGGDRKGKESEEGKKGEEEADRARVVWDGMRDGWVGVCRGLEVMGSE